MGCLSFTLTTIYFWIVAGIAAEAREPGVVFWGVLFWMLGRNVLSSITGTSEAEEESTRHAEHASFRRFLLLRERVARAAHHGVITPEQAAAVLSAQGARERRFRSLASSLRGREADDPVNDSGVLQRWLRVLVEQEKLSLADARAIMDVPLEGPHPGTAPVVAAEPEPEADAAPDLHVLPSEPVQVPLIAKAMAEAKQEVLFIGDEPESEPEPEPEPEPEAEPEAPEGSTEEVAPGVSVWTPEATPDPSRDMGAVLATGEAEVAGPTFWQRLKANFMEEGQVRWAEAFFALFTLLAFVTGVVSVGYYWSHFHPLLRFAFLVVGAAGSCGLARKVHGLEGLEETGRTLAVISHLLVPVALGALPFLVKQSVGGMEVALGLVVGTAVLGFGLAGVSSLALGAYHRRYPHLFLGASASAGLLPMLLVESPMRGLVLTAFLLAWLGAVGARPGEGEEWSGGRLVRLCLPVYLMAVAVGAAAGIAPLAPGAWAFAASMAGFLLWTAGLEEGAGGDAFPGVPMGLMTAGFALMGLGSLAGYLVEPVFWSNTWLLAALAPPFFASTISAVRVGTGRAAYTSATLLTMLAVIAAGPELGAHSTLVLLPVAGAALGAMLLAGRAPGAARAYARAAGGLLCYALAQGIRVPVEGLTSSVALLMAALPLVLVLGSRPAVLLASASAAGTLVFGSHVLWTAPARAGLAPLGPWAGPMAAAPWLLLAGAGLAALQRWIGPALARRLRPARGGSFWAREEPLGHVHLPLGLAALPGLLTALAVGCGWTPLLDTHLPGAPGIPGLWAHALGALLLGLAGLPRALDDRLLSRHLVTGSLGLVPPLLGAWLGGVGGAALGLGVSALAAAHLAAHASGDLPGGDPRVRFRDPLPLTVVGAGVLFLAFVAVPDLLGWLLDPVSEVPPIGPAIAAGLMILAGHRFHRARPFAWHLHLAPLWVAYAVLSLSQYFPDAVRLGFVAMSAGAMALYGISERWSRFLEYEARAGGGPAAAGWQPLADVPLALAVFAFAGSGEACVDAILRTLWDVVFGLVSRPYGGGWTQAAEAGVWTVLGLGAVLMGVRHAYASLRGLGTLGGVLVSLGVCHLVDALWWPGHLRPTCAVLSAGFSVCLLELLALQLPRERLANTARHLRLGALNLILLVAFAGAGLAAHRSQMGPVYDSLKHNWGGAALALAVFFIAFSGWGRASRGEEPGAHRMSTSFGIAVGLTGAWLGGLTGAAWGFALACLLGAELGSRQGDGSVGGGPDGSIGRPLVTGALVAAGFFVGTILLPDILFEQLALVVIPAALLMVRAGYSLNRAAPFAAHLHSGPAFVFYALWMSTRALPASQRASVLGAAGFVVALLGFTAWWERVATREAEAGGGPAAWGMKPLVDVTLVVGVVAIVYGYYSMASSFGQTFLALCVPWRSKLPHVGGRLPEELGILPLLGVGATLAAARARAAYVRFLGAGYLGGAMLGFGLTHALALAAPATLPCLGRVVAAVLVAWGLDQLAVKVGWARYPSLPRHLRTGSAALLAALCLSGFLRLQPLTGAKQALVLGAPLLVYALSLAAASLLALRLARRGTWGMFSWPWVWLALCTVHQGAVLAAHLAGAPLPRFHHGSYAVWVILGTAQLVGWSGLRLATPNMGRHLGWALALLSAVGLFAWVDVLDRAGYAALLLRHRPAFLGAVLVGVVVALLRRGEPGAREQLMVAVPVGALVFAVPAAWPLAVAGIGLHLAGLHAGTTRFTWGALLLGGAGGGMTVAGLGYHAFRPDVANVFSAGFALGAALFVRFARVGLDRYRRLEGDPPRLIGFWPVHLLDRQVSLLGWAVSGLVGILFVPVAAEFLPVFGPAVRYPWSMAAYAGLLAAAATALAGREDNPRPSTAAGLAWAVFAGYLLAAPFGGALTQIRAYGTASAYGVLLGCLALSRISGRFGPNRRAAVLRASRLGVGLAIARLVFCLEVSAPDLAAVLAAALPALGAAFLWRDAAREESETLVYAGEAAAACCFLYLRLSGLIGDTLYGQLTLQTVAFVLLGVAEKLRDGEHSVFHRPFLRTAKLIPAFVMLRMLMPIDWKGFDGWGQFSLGAMASAFYALVGLREDKAVLRYLGGACFYLGLSLLLLRYYDMTRFWEHMDFYVVPLGMLVVLFSVLEKENLLEEQQRTMQTVGLLLVYISPAVHALFDATAPETIALMLLGMLGILVGRVTRTGLFTLYGLVALGTGVGSYLLNIYRMAHWNFAFLTFSTLAVGFGVYSAKMRRERKELGLS